MNQILLENAACLWEAYLALGKPVNRHGTAQTRSLIVALAPQAELGWRHAQASGFEDPFDWEFCPLFIDECIDYPSVTLKPDYLEICRSFA